MKLVVQSVLAVVIHSTAHAQIALGVSLGDVDGAAAFEALARECYEAGMVSDRPSASVMDCMDPLEEPVGPDADGDAARVVMRTKLRFTLIERAGQGRIAGDAWTETDELGTVIEEPVTSQEYLQRVQDVLTAVIARLRTRSPPPWLGRYDSEQAWRLAAHLDAVSHCDANLAGMTLESLGEQLESIGLRALSGEARDRCEQLYTHLYEWAFAQGRAKPTVEEYARYRAALPPEQRLCSGQLAREATCR